MQIMYKKSKKMFQKRLTLVSNSRKMSIVTKKTNEEIMKKVITTAIVLTSVFVAAQSAAAVAIPEAVLGKVTKVVPIESQYETYIQQQVCRNVTVPKVTYVPIYETRRSVAAPIMGALVGGAITRGITKGSHRNEAAAVGALLGAYTQRNKTVEVEVGRREHVVHVQERQCQIESRPETRTETTGYRVTYEFEGESNTVVMDQKPGQFVRLRTEVSVY